MIRLEIGGRNHTSTEIQLPESWNELTGNQLEQLATALLGGGENYRKKIEVARVLIGNPDLFSKIAPEVMLQSIFPLCEWVYGNIDLTRQIIPELQLSDLTLYGPKSELSNLTLVEWDFCERLLNDWIEEEDKLQVLAKLCAVLYRPARPGYDFVLDPEGDGRQPFNDNVLTYYANRILSEIRPSLLLAVLFWYRGCRNIITDSFRVAFTKSNGSAVGDTGYFDLMRAIAKEGIYGDFDKVEKMYLYNALQEIKATKEEADRIKAANTSNK